MEKNITIENIMTPDPITVDTEDTMTQVISKIKKYNFDHLPVIDKWNNLLGIISKTDLYQRALSLSQSTTGESYTKKVLFVTTAEDIMTGDPVVVSPQHSVDYAIDLLLKGDFHALPVVLNTRLVGIITSKDILKHIMRNPDTSKLLIEE